ncbi:MAG: hypothetical protein GY865_17770 [candidate division Zixibacteria bacterium]|nr:hypothetical protein [candidate division Zixibacteria bacterium]
MKFVAKSVALILLLLLFVIPSFGENVVSYDLEQELDRTPRENEEAELAALWLSNKIVAPQDLYEKVLGGFSLLREKYSDSIPEVNIQFRFPFDANGVSIGLDTSAIELIRAGKYNAWDSLNSYYRFIKLDTNDYSYGDINMFHVSIFFEGRLNYFMVAEEYAKLPGVRYASFGLYFGGDRSTTHPWVDSTGNISFLVRKAWGDCPAGCLESHYFYFKMISDDIIYIGDWEPTYPPSTPPIWWEEAEVAVQYDKFYDGSLE